MSTVPQEGLRPLGPLHVSATLLTSRKVGAFHHLTLAAPGIPERFRPGTFVAVSVGGQEALRLARRSFWVHRVKPTGGHGLTLEIVVEVVGPGTRWLAALPPGAAVEVTGPLGRPFSLPKDSPDQKRVSCVLVGHGHAAAPLFSLAERLRERGCAVTLVVSAPDEAHLLAALEARRSARAVTVVTGDGSVGLRGGVEDHLHAILEKAGLEQAGADVVYAAGPAPLLHAVAAAAEAQGAWSQVALEEPLVCATGLCHGCAVPVVGEDGAPREVRSCVDGPVFRGDRVRWADLVGAELWWPSLGGWGVRIGALRLSSPVMVASGCGGTGRELAAYTDLRRLGAFVTRSITLDARPGGEMPRIVETPGGLVNAVGFDNPGLEHFLATELPWLVGQGATVIVSIAGASMGEYADLARRLGRAPGLAAVEVNLSAPDALGGGVLDIREPFQAAGVVSAVRRDLPRDLPVIAKLRTDVFRVVETARIVSEAGADAVVIGNALPAALPDGRAGGLSGPAVRPLALRCVADVHAELPDLTVVAAGGITTAEDARAFLSAGAVAVQVGTALLHDPTTAERLVADLEPAHTLEGAAP